MKMIDKKKMLELLIELHKIDIENSKTINAFYSLGIDCECELIKRIFKTFQYALDQTAICINDQYKWLEWFIFETEWGKNNNSVIINDINYDINTFEDLIIMLNPEKD